MVLLGFDFFEEEPVAQQALTFDELALMLSGYGDAIGASECHGILCGMLSCQIPLDAMTWATRMLSAELQEQQGASPASSINEADKAMLEGLFGDTVRQMGDHDLGFQLLLPDDMPLKTRTEGLAFWCEGYLYGLSLGGIKEFNVFSEPVQDFSKDLVEISRLTHEDEDNEENEVAFFDVVEYVRMGVLMLTDELSSVAPQGKQNSSGDDVVLH